MIISSWNWTQTKNLIFLTVNLSQNVCHVYAFFYLSDEAKKKDVMMKLAELYNMTNQKDMVK